MEPATMTSSEGSQVHDGNGSGEQPGAGVEFETTMSEAPLVDPDPPLDEVEVSGTSQLGLFDAGGKKPKTSSLKLSGGAIKIVDGEAFKKGDTIKLEVIAVVRAVAQVDTADKATQQVVSSEQKHTALITDVRIVETSE